MISYEQLLEQVNLNCHINNASAFEMVVLSPISWTKKYTAKKIFFSYRWTCVDSYVDSSEKCTEAERLLSKLPKGISYVKNTTITTPLPEKVEPYHTVYEWYSTTYTVIVSEEYSKSIVQKNRDNQVVIATVFDKRTLQEADNFKNIVLNSHTEILDPLFTRGLQPYGCLTNTGFTDYDHGYSFQTIGMKPLFGEAQRLGLAIALSNYGTPHLKSGQFYYISRFNADAIDIRIRDRASKKDVLKDW
ncbi:MAG: hypothetical protein J1F23_04940 [Oscillospiraceae bacterium]|nr:hypothetical protein [Oscillospiraceae bacterium]